MDFNIKLRNGKVLSGMIQSPGENTKAVIIMIHGLGEHIHRYVSWAELFRKENIAFAGVDLPGHGSSEGRRGHINNYKIIWEMIDILLVTCSRTFPGIPIYIYGHSLGGGIVLEYLLKRNPKVNGAIVTSPWLRLSFEPPRSKLLLASIIKSILPWLLQPSGLNFNHMSHNEEAVEKFKNDPLAHRNISVGLYYSAMKSAKYSLACASDLKTPTLLLHGSDDLITSPDSSREFAGKTSLVHLKIWENGYHELHNEPFREEVFKYIINWIDRKDSYY